MIEPLRPRLALTMGDPAGIGPELVVRAAADKHLQTLADFVIYGESDILQEAADRWSNGNLPPLVNCGILPFSQLHIGQADAAAGKLAFDTLDRAIADARSGTVDAIVTAPMNKYAVNLAGIPFSGHTERLAELCRCENYVMMQSAGSLRMVFATTHIPIAEVSKVLTTQRIVDCAKLLADAIHSEGCSDPVIAIAALNPHAGENGCMGNEEKTIISPAISALRRQGVDAVGPLVPDVLFVENIRKNYNGIVCMYHDQGHIPFKMLAFDRGVNSTLGLPIIRTSPDHGTAFDRAWRGNADCGSFFAAVELAAKRALRRKL